MRPILYFFAALLTASLLAACSGRKLDSDYNAEACAELSVKVEHRDSLTQQDYTRMIGQNEAILRYLVEQSKLIADEAPEDRQSSWRQLLADPEYLERFGYMFTLGSALYQADAEGKLDAENKKLYASLDRYNAELAEYSDRN